MASIRILYFSLFLLPALAQAQDAASGERADALEPVQVTATRVAATVDASLADVSVITRAQIDASGAPDLIGLLRLEAGVDVARGGGPGEQTAVFLRGTNANHVLVLIDGVRVASANTGAFAFENLPLDAVERIEIVRGPRASYWGSDAIGGVIQVFTRQLDGARIAARYGTWRDAAGSAGIGGASQSGAFSVQAGARHVGGFSATNPGVCAGPDDPYCIYNPDANGYHQHDLVAHASTALGAQTLAATLFRNEGGVSFDNGSFGPGYSTTLDQAFGVSLAGALTPDWDQRLALASAREDLDTPAFASSYRSTREQLAWTNAVALAHGQQLVAGGDAVHERGISIDRSGFGAPYDVARDNLGVFGGWHGAGRAFAADAAMRYDHNGDFGSAVSGSAALGWDFAAGWRLSASAGSAFRAPNLNELYSPGYGGYYAGNAALDPERSRTAELALDFGAGSAGRFSARAFSTRVRDLIDFSGGTTFQAVNIAHAAIDGGELVQHWRDGAWTLDSTLTLQNPRDADSGRTLVRRPRRKLASELGAHGERFDAGLEFLASGKAADVGGATLGGYTLVALRGGWSPSPQWRFGARLDNLFDRSYELVHGYNTPGRSLSVTAVWQPR